MCNTMDMVLHFLHKMRAKRVWCSLQEEASAREIIEKLERQIWAISYRTYFRKRQMASDALSSVLWGYSSKESLALLEKFVP